MVFCFHRKRKLNHSSITYIERFNIVSYIFNIFNKSLLIMVFDSNNKIILSDMQNLIY